MSPEPTAEQRERMSRIVNENQRRALERAIANGDRIPDYAWHPVPVLPPEAEERIRGLASRLIDDALAKGRNPYEQLEAATPYLEDVDFGFRPDTYWPENGRGIKHSEGRTDDFLPELGEGEVEIARLELASVTADLISVRAHRTPSWISYRVADEYGSKFVISPRTSKRPLELGALIRLINGLGGSQDERFEGRFIDGLREGSLVAGDEQKEEDLQEAAEFVAVRSTFYPQLEVHFYWEAEDWLERRRRFGANPAYWGQLS